MVAWHRSESYGEIGDEKPVDRTGGEADDYMLREPLECPRCFSQVTKKTPPER